MGKEENMPPQLEERTAKVEGILEQMDKRLGQVEIGLTELRKEFKTDFDSLRNDLKSNFQWTIGITITLWVCTMGMIGGIMAILLRG